MRLISSHATRSALSPLWRRGGEGGVTNSSAVVTPLPNPPPQGGRERTVDSLRQPRPGTQAAARHEVTRCSRDPCIDVQRRWTPDQQRTAAALRAVACAAAYRTTQRVAGNTLLPESGTLRWRSESVCFLPPCGGGLGRGVTIGN